MAVCNAVEWAATNLKAEYAGAISPGARIVTSMSWNWRTEFPCLNDQLRDNKRIFDIPQFVSAGNDWSEPPTPSPVRYPATSPDVFAIYATDQNDQRPLFSRYGPEVDLAAPGQDIFTADRTGSAGYTAGDFTVIRGTSHATPLVAGTAALMLSQDSALPVDEIGDRLCATSVPVAGAEYGCGRIDALGALSVIFVDGFEGGDTSAWSQTVGN